MIGTRRFAGEILAGALLLAASGQSGQAEEPRFPFDTVWVAESLGEQRFASVSRPTLRVTHDGHVSGSAGCNRYNAAGVKIEGGKISLGPVAMTKMACFGAGGDNERMYAPALSTATAWRIERRALVLDTSSGPLRFRRR